MPVLSLSTSSCMATIPIKAKASRPIHKRPRISLSTKALLEMPSRAWTPRSAMPGVAPAEARLLPGAERLREGELGRAGRFRGSATPGAGIATAAASEPEPAGALGPDTRLARRGAARRLPVFDRSDTARLGSERAVAGGVMLDLLDRLRDLQALPQHADAPRRREGCAPSPLPKARSSHV